VQTSDSAAPGSRVSARFFRPPPIACNAHLGQIKTGEIA